ncbi:MAG: diaminopimelate epimerase, partial [Candidatus Eremiobacteraeota bacterium]|nr:diaminopimelate epimerase [Candidatus Eremiobacteraeota bacterium]
MSAVPVTKMHGAHNDFVVIDLRRRHTIDLPRFARTVCDRRAGVGADGLLVIGASVHGDAQMMVYNADGSQAEMCGNGARCVARYLSEAGAGDSLVLETASGSIHTWIESRDPFNVRVNMGAPKFEPISLPYAEGVYVSLGNPHVVIFETDLDALDLAAVAEKLHADEQFPAGINVHVAVKA